MTADEKFIIVKNMRAFGGGFIQSLGEALMRADAVNTIRIERAFPDYCERYLNFKADE